MPKHEFTRIRQEPPRRTLQVVSKQQVTPHMLRLVFRSENLHGFQSPSADDHIKVFFPVASGAPPLGRHFTPRAWDLEAGTLTLDFALHPHGPAVEWAQGAQAGDTVEIGGPRGSLITPDDFDWYLLIGDATALPAIGRYLEHLPHATPVHVFALVEGDAESTYLPNHPAARTTWLPRSNESTQDTACLLEVLRQADLPAGDGFVWIAAETAVARAAYRYIVDDWAHPKEWVKAAGYWSADKEDGGERIA